MVFPRMRTCDYEEEINVSDAIDGKIRIAECPTDPSKYIMMYEREVEDGKCVVLPNDNNIPFPTIEGLAEYHVAYMCIYSDVVEATSPEEAAKIVEMTCPYNIDGAAHVTRIDTDIEWDI